MSNPRGVSYKLIEERPHRSLLIQVCPCRGSGQGSGTASGMRPFLFPDEIMKYALFIDGGFAIKKLHGRTGGFPSAEDVVNLAGTIGADQALGGAELLRNYFYHARPLGTQATNPISGDQLDFRASPVYRQHTSLLDQLEVEDNFAVRTGDTVYHGWKLGSRAERSLFQGGRAVEANDLVPNIQQKGVDLKIGLDMARLAFKGVVDTVVVCSGDSDLVPAFKLARTEGVKVFLATMGHGVRRDMKVHVDKMLNV